MNLSIMPVTSDLWPQFEELFGRQGACYGCWCTYFRLSPAQRRASSSAQNMKLMKSRIETGPPPGLLALKEGVPVGWMQVGPRADVPEWNNARRGSAPLADGEARDPSVWAISCFFVRARSRGQGITHHLVAGGIDHARKNGARYLDACPIDLSRDSRSVGLYVGSTRVFEKAGFSRVAERKRGRPLMRLEIRGA